MLKVECTMQQSQLKRQQNGRSSLQQREASVRIKTKKPQMFHCDTELAEGNMSERALN